MKPVVGPVERDGIRLRLLEEPDLPLTLEWRNRSDVRRWFLTPDVIEPQQHRSWFESYRQKDDDLVFMIEETQRWKRPIGQLALYRIDPVRQTAEFGRLMIGDQAARGAGLGSRATQLALAVGFNTLGLRRIYLEVLASNVRAIEIYKTLGFAETASNAGIVSMQIDAGPDQQRRINATTKVE